MQFHVLASGSKGNCFVLYDKDIKIMIDCGTTKKYLSQSFHILDLKYHQLDAVLITHTHSDHISQIELFKDNVIYAPTQVDKVKVYHIKPLVSFEIGHLTITPIPLSHDTKHTVGYIIENESEKLVYVTDTGYFSDSNKALIVDADYYIFESNHDPELLMTSARPFYVKQRILSATGHLCNQEAAEILSKVVTTRCKEIVLAHISEDGNDYELAQLVTSNRLNGLNIKVHAAKQFEIYSGGSI